MLLETEVPSVMHLFRAPKRRLPMEELEEILAVEDSGFEGCAHARPGDRADARVLEQSACERCHRTGDVEQEDQRAQARAAANTPQIR